MTKREARGARKAGTLRDYEPSRLRAAAVEYRHAVALERWARRYDRLNGAPESEEDR